MTVCAHCKRPLNLERDNVVVIAQGGNAGHWHRECYDDPTGGEPIPLVQPRTVRYLGQSAEEMAESFQRMCAALSALPPGLSRDPPHDPIEAAIGHLEAALRELRAARYPRKP